MKKIREFTRSPMGTTFMFMIAVLFLMTGTIGGVRATPQIFNPQFAYGGVKLDEIGVSLIENGNVEKPVTHRNYKSGDQEFDWDPEMGTILSDLIPAGEKIKLGYRYPEQLSVLNSGSISQYVRVKVYKYWIDPQNENKKYNGIPESLIKLDFNENDWTIDKSANSSTDERTILYYKGVLKAGEETENFLEYITIDPSVIDYAEKTITKDKNTVTWVADGKMFQLEVEVDAVQNHNANAAIKSAWGVDYSSVGITLETVES